MSLPVTIRPAARDETEEAARWYEGKQVGLGEAFLAELQRVLDAIAEQPDRFPVALGKTREASLRRFPYCVYYRVRPDRIVVTAVFHTSRDPSVWQRRT